MKFFSKVIITILILITCSLLLYNSRFARAQENSSCTFSELPSAVEYGTDFRIVVDSPYQSGRASTYKLSLSGPYQDYGWNYNGTGGNSHAFEFKNEHEDDGNNMGKLSHLPPGIESDQQKSRTYTVFAEVAAGQNRATCQGEITILPATTDNYPPITDYPEIPASERGGGTTGFKVEPMDVKDGKSTLHTNTIIDGNTDEVRVTFTGLSSNESYKVCLQNDQKRCYISDDFDLEGDDLDKEGNTIVINHLCGAGKDSLKRRGKDTPCNPNEDYFHEGQWYTVGLYSQNYRSGPLAEATFYVSYAYPHVFIPIAGSANENFNAFDITREATGIVEIENPFDVTIEQYVKPGKSKKERNNFQIVLESLSGNQKVEKCIEVKGSVSSLGRATQRFNYGELFGGGSSGPIPPGEYLLKINEQNRENDWKTLTNDDCQGGFTYYHIPISVQLSDDKQTIKTTIDYSKVEKDPNRVEIKDINERLNQGPLPCAVGIIRKDDGTTEEVPITDENILHLQECTQFATAFGTFGLTPLEFIKTLGSWLLSIGSIAAIGFMIYSGYILMTSRGDKEKIGQAREILTSAVTGLIFLILSITILEIIGVDILQIPGFSR